MDFDLSDDQIALQEGARELLDGLAAPAQARAHTASGAAFDAALWAAMADRAGSASGVRARRRRARPGEVAVLCRSSGATPRPRRSPRRCWRSRRSPRPATTRGSTGWSPAMRSHASRGTPGPRCPTHRRPTSRSCSPTMASTHSTSRSARRASPRWISPASSVGCRSIATPHAGSATPTRVSGCSTGARRSRLPTSSAPRRGRSSSQSSTPRTASSSAARSARSKP